jgi:hypothetical protein
MINGAPSLSLNLRNLTTEQQYRLMEIGLQVLVERGLTLTDVAHVAQVFERAKAKPITAAEAGRLGGRQSSPRKAKASAANGALGGRPKGTTGTTYTLSPAQRRAAAQRMADLWKAGKITAAKINKAKRKATIGPDDAKRRARNRKYYEQRKARDAAGRTPKQRSDAAAYERRKARLAKATYKMTEAQRAKQRERNQRYQANLKARLADAERFASEHLAAEGTEPQQGGGQ